MLPRARVPPDYAHRVGGVPGRSPAADAVMQVEVRRPADLETTSLGAAFAAGIGSGWWTAQWVLGGAGQQQAQDTVFRPQAWPCPTAASLAPGGGLLEQRAAAPDAEPCPGEWTAGAESVPCESCRSQLSCCSLHRRWVPTRRRRDTASGSAP